MLDILLFAALGILLGVIMGLIPGLHPNMLILAVPLIVQFNIPPLPLIAFIVSLGISNTFLDFIPSMLFGAPDAGKELAVLPAHRMLMQGNGYDAVKLAVVGGLGSMIFIMAALPVLAFVMPTAYSLLYGFTYAFLIFIAAVMILSENSLTKKATAGSCFALAGIIGLISSSMPVDRTLVLFPILSGLFGVSVLLFSARAPVKISKNRKEVYVSGRQTRRSVVFGSIGGIVSGFLPGVGTSEIASLASVDKDEKAFIITVGAITISNTLLSVLALWLIGRSRSGLAVVLEQLTTIGFGEFVFIAAVALSVAGVSALVTLYFARRATGVIEKVNYSRISMVIIGMIFFMTILFTGLYGILLLVTCTALGVFAKLSGIRRGVLMGVLIVPTILFYLPL